MVFAGPHHAAPMGLKTVLFGRWYYKHVAPTQLAAYLPAVPTVHHVIDCARKLGKATQSHINATSKPPQGVLIGRG
jgi:hypothetical protein